MHGVSYWGLQQLLIYFCCFRFPPWVVVLWMKGASVYVFEAPSTQNVLSYSIMYPFGSSVYLPTRSLQIKSVNTAELV